MSILSDRQDGAGYWYGFRDGDYRQINVCVEFHCFAAYVGGERIPGKYTSKDQAEAAAIKWAEDNPPDQE